MMLEFYEGEFYEGLYTKNLHHSFHLKIVSSLLENISPNLHLRVQESTVWLICLVHKHLFTKRYCECSIKIMHCQALNHNFFLIHYSIKCPIWSNIIYCNWRGPGTSDSCPKWTCWQRYHCAVLNCGWHSHGRYNNQSMYV